jgi:uncharacterized protein YsxB (DUF464 family)
MIHISADLGHGMFRLVVDGHEERAEQGRVCAAVSAITQTALLGLQAVAEEHPDIVSIEITEK